MEMTETGTAASITAELQRKWVAAITHDDYVLVRQILDEYSIAERSSELLEERLIFSRPLGTLKQQMRQLSVTSYSPDTPWCLAAVCDSRNVMQVLLEYGADVLQVNYSGNNLLHVLAALSSTGNESTEEEIVATAKYIRHILETEVYEKLLLTENSDGLRPLELASHLGSFALFMFYFCTLDVYITREEEYTLYKIQYFEITEYITGVRHYQSPLNGMLHVEEGRISSKSVEDMYQNDPMRGWLDATYFVNIPIIVLWAVFRVTYIVLFLASASVNSVTTNLIISWIILIISILIIVVDFVDFIRNMVFRPRWIKRVVYGRKRTAINQTFYRITHFAAVVIVAIITTVSLVDYYRKSLSYDISGYGVIAAVYGFVWSGLYFFQILPVFGHYVMAVQRMLKDFANFAFLFLLFFVTYSVGFYKLLNTTVSLPEFATFPSSLYGTFRVMLNMVDFREVRGDISADVYVLHITFVFMIAVLLMNFLIATLSSSYEHVMNYRSVFVPMQILSVSMASDGRFQTFLSPVRNYLLRRYFLHNKGRYFVCRVIDQGRTQH